MCAISVCLYVRMEMFMDRCMHGWMNGCVLCTSKNIAS